MSERWARGILREMEPSLIRRLAAALMMLKDVIVLAGGDPDFPTPSHIVEAAVKALKEGVTHYTPTQGIPQLREAIAAYYKKFSVEVNPEKEVIVTPGSQQALYLTLACTVEPGDEVLIPDPSYLVYVPTVRFLGGKPVRFALKAEGFHLDLEEIKARITDRSKILILCSPNNPTGTVFTEEELKGVAELAEEHDLLVISDEIYSEFVWDGRRYVSMASIPGMKERTVVVVSFSKTFAMTGWRLGYLIAPGGLVEQMLKIQGNMVLCPTAHVQVAGVAALTGPWEPIKKMAEEYNRRREYLVKRLNEIEGINCPRPEGAFYLFPDISEVSKSSVEFCEGLMKEKRVAIVPGSAFGPHGEGHVRIPLVKPIEVLEEAAKRIEDYVKTLKA